ncbi:MAG: Hpt domain-containing protein [Rhodobacteraceae bacterium]|nr:Hpt domain-containing protein [Paracoccaceae bacterium]
MIDWIRIDELRDEVGQDDFGDIVGVFFEEVQEALENLRRADTVVTLLGQLHFLQGSALNLGFSNFAAICRNPWKLIRFAGHLAPQNNNSMRAIR